jgi:hypothetical protein
LLFFASSSIIHYPHISHLSSIVIIILYFLLLPLFFWGRNNIWFLVFSSLFFLCIFYK